ncbi:MAG TPA: hypothetical protein PKD26_12940 [Pyrinomonadaceae bacterium]|nr:hypothetical protein [Pyrinomonadaceae bacterium]
MSTTRDSIRESVGPSNCSIFLLFAVIVCSISCGVPNLDPPECTVSRSAVREFYSFHFGNDMSFSAENLQARQKFITQQLYASLASSVPGTDPFTTGTADIPKAFRVAACRALSSERAEFEILIFWKDDERSEQRTIRVEAEKIGEQWLVSRVVQG